MIRPGDMIGLLRETVTQWYEAETVRLAAALAYFAGFSMAPLLLVSTALASQIIGADQVENQVVTTLRDLLGNAGAESIRSAIEAITGNSQTSAVVTAISAVALLLSATGLFRQLKSALNAIWDVPPAEPSKVRGFVLDSVVSLLFVVGTSLLLLLALVISAALFAWVRSLDTLYPDLRWLPLWRALAVVLLYAGVTLLFAIIYKALPDARVSWRDVWVGAALTALLFLLGQVAIGMAFSVNDISSTYGAASALMVVLAWVYLSAHLVLLGAAFTKVYANRIGSKVIATANAEMAGSELSPGD